LLNHDDDMTITMRDYLLSGSRPRR